MAYAFRTTLVPLQPDQTIDVDALRDQINRVLTEIGRLLASLPLPNEPDSEQ
jgi:hypothetical protein